MPTGSSDVTAAHRRMSSETSVKEVKIKVTQAHTHTHSHHKTGNTVGKTKPSVFPRRLYTCLDIAPLWL